MKMKLVEWFTKNSQKIRLDSHTQKYPLPSSRIRFMMEKKVLIFSTDFYKEFDLHKTQ